MKKIVMGTVFLLMFSWALYELLASQADKTAVEDSEESEIAQTEEDSPVTSLADDDVAESEADEEEEEQTDAVIGLYVGNMAPDFQLVNLEGEEVRLSEFRGERVMINFWATWCPPCRVEMPDMEKFHQDTDIVILAVNLTETESSVDQVQDFVDEFELTFPILLDETLTVATEYEIHPLPTSLLVDSNGLIHNIAYGALNYDQMVSEFDNMQ